MTPTKDQILAALGKTERLAPAPRTLGRVLRLLRHPDSGIHAIAELISCDSGLAVDVLRCANSAFYSRGTRIAAINDAVQLIGFHETIRIVSLVAIRQTTHRDLSSYGIPAEDFWAESLFNGLFLEALARRPIGIEAGEAYTAGLLRFIGRLAINQALEELGFGLFWDRATSLPEWEIQNVGVTQAEIGGRLLRKWEFPEHMIVAIERQDALASGADDVPHPFVQALGFTAQVLPAGSGLASIEALPGSAPAGVEDTPFAQRHGITPEVVLELLREARTQFLEIRETLYR